MTNFLGGVYNSLGGGHGHFPLEGSFSTGGGLWYLGNCGILVDFGVVFGSQ